MVADCVLEISGMAEVENSTYKPWQEEGTTRSTVCKGHKPKDHHKLDIEKSEIIKELDDNKLKTDSKLGGRKLKAKKLKIVEKLEINEKLDDHRLKIDKKPEINKESEDQNKQPKTWKSWSQMMTKTM